MITLKPPPSHRIAGWPALHSLLLRVKKLVENLHRRRGFPPCLFVTEFDEAEIEGLTVDCAAFHLGFAAVLTEGQQATFREWFRLECGLRDNQGRAFRYDADGGGIELQDYLSKELDMRQKPWRLVKFCPSWVPERPGCRLWFIVGAGRRRPSNEGRTLRAKEGIIRKRFEGEQGKQTPCKLSVCKEAAECEQGTPLITADDSALESNGREAVPEQTAEEVCKSRVDPLASLRALSPVSLCGGTVMQVYGLLRAMPHQMLSLRLDLGGLEIATQLHFSDHLRLVCAPPSGSILHMLIAEGSSLPASLRMRLQKGTAVPRAFEVVYCRTASDRLQKSKPSIRAADILSKPLNLVTGSGM